MRTAIAWKTWRETQLLFWLLLIVVFIFEHIFIFAIRQFAPDLLQMWKRFPFMIKLIQTLLGAKLEMDATATSLITLGFSHPFLFAVIWTFIVANCTRVVVGEIDRRTADFMLTLPISRTGMYSAVTAVWILIGIPACVIPWVGIWFASRIFPLSEPPDFPRLWLPIVNLFMLYVAIGCVTMWVSSMQSRRGPAVAIVIAILLASFIINFLVALVPGLSVLGYLGILEYYRPLESVRTGQLPFGNLAVLGGIALVSWSAGLFVFARRDIPAA